MPEFAALWQDMLQAPTTLMPAFGDVSQLLATRTRKRYVVRTLWPTASARLPRLGEPKQRSGPLIDRRCVVLV